MGKWESAIPGYYIGAAIVYFFLRWDAIRREKKIQADIEALVRERDEKVRELNSLLRESHVIKSMRVASDDTPEMQ